MKYIFILIYIIFTTLGLVFFKIGGTNPLSISFNNGLGIKIGYVSLLGFLFYICSFLLWQRLLIIYDLSYIVPITTGIIQCIVLLLGVFLFKENINAFNVFGVVFIIIGLILLSVKR